MHIDYLFADACPCGEPRADETFCADCRAAHENLLSRALASLPNQADPVPPWPDLFEQYRAAYDWACVKLDERNVVEVAA